MVVETNQIVASRGRQDKKGRWIQQLETKNEDISNAVTTVPKDNMVLNIKQATKSGSITCKIGGVVDLNYPTSKTRRGRVQENGEISPTLTTENIPNVVEFGDSDFYNFIYELDGELYLIRIRKLTPKECWRLMGFCDEDFDKASQVNSNTQLYKEAGNSIVVNVLEKIFKNLLEG